MSLLTQTTQAPARRKSPPTGWIVIAVVVGGVLFALRGVLPHAADMMLQARPHLPDLTLWNAQPMVIKAHMLAGLGALALGTALMVMRKGVTLHRIMGWSWASLMALAAGASLFITGLNGDHWSFIHLFSGWVLIVLPIALAAARRHRVQLHRRMMTGLFFGGLVVTSLLTFIPGRLMWQLFFG